MILDTLGVGFLGTSTEVFHKAGEYSKVRSSMTTSEIKPSVHTHLLTRWTQECTQGCAFVSYATALLSISEIVRGIYSTVVYSLVLVYALLPKS